MAIELYRFGNLARLPWLTHAISTRLGGVSDGPWASLNTSYSVGDQAERVDENIRRFATAAGVGARALVWAYQVHGREAVSLNSDAHERPRCDILVTRAPDRVPALRFADCTPVLLADPVSRAVAVAHAGWRGTAARAAAAAVEALRTHASSDPANLVAGIGPAIGPCCYTVGSDVVQAFEDRPWAIVRPTAGETRLDLWEANRRALEEAGVPAAQIEVAGICTRCESDRFFSHRANHGQPAGRFAALIAIRA